MPSKNKRSAAAAAKEESKKPRTDPKLAPITSAISKVGHLPEPCKQLLIAILPPSLGSGSSPERHESQIAALDMIEETLQQEKSSIQERIAASEQKLAELNSLKTEKDGEQATADTALKELKDEEQKKEELLKEASEAKCSAEKAFAEAKDAKTEGGKTFEANKQEKESLETALLNHYKTPMDADEGPHFAALQPFLCKLTLDESLQQALPSSCVKPKEQRGSFDIVVLEELQKAFATKIAELGSKLEAEAPLAEELDSKVRDAESDLETKKTNVQEHTGAFEAAQKNVQEATQAVMAASKAVSTAAANVQAEVRTCDALKFQLSEFESGPLATFTALKKPAAPLEKVEAAEEVATAGA